MSLDRSRSTAPLIALLGGYQRWVGPFLGPRCRFYPSCSSYAMQALTAHGLVRGCWLALRRVLRCQPFAAGGIDQVPGRTAGRRIAGRHAPIASPGAPSP